MENQYPRKCAIDGGGCYEAQAVGPYGFWVTVDKNGFNCAVFDENGRTLGTKEEAMLAADKFNGR